MAHYHGEQVVDQELQLVNGDSEEEGGGVSWSQGQEVEVYSRSKDRWIAAVIRKVMRENGEDWIQVYYKNSTQMKDVRADSKDIRVIARRASPKFLKHGGAGDQKSTGLGFTKILHKIAAISKQVEGGLYLIKRVATVIHRLAHLEQTHVQASKKALDQEKHKLKEKFTDEMTRCVDAWEGTEMYLTSQLNKREQLATKMEQQIATPMMEFFNDSELKRKAIIKDEKKYGVEMNRAKLGVQKNLRNCQKLIKSCIVAKSEEEEKKKGGPVKKNKFGGMLKWAKNMMRGSLQDLQTQAASAAKNYIASIEYANERQKKHFEKELPLICKQFEMLERSRMNALYKYLNMLNTLSYEHADPVIKYIEAHKASVTNINPDLDIGDFAANIIRNYGDVPEIEPYTYQLSCQLKDIKAGRFEGNPNSFFFATLEHCMELQSGKHSNLDVPIIVVNMIEAIRKLGGFTVEGIFRLSAKKDDLVRLRKQFDQGIYAVKETSPHVPAGLLKQWLRELAEPLIPTEKYAEAIEIARSKPELQDVQNFVEKLPGINLNVLKHISSMAKEIAAQSAVNKMTFSNLAIVFAPGMLRNPSEDPHEMLENSKYETLFTKFLLQTG